MTVVSSSHPAMPPSTTVIDLLSALARDDTRTFQTDEQRRTELLADVVAAAWGTHGEFIDADQFLTKPTVLRRLASILASRVPVDTDRLLGREPHSLVLGAALALETGLPLVVVRTPDPPASQELRCFGELHAGERVLVVEGVTGTGGSAEQAVQAAQRHDVTVAGVLAAVDRAAGAAERLDRLGIRFDVLFHDAELRFVAARARELA